LTASRQNREGVACLVVVVVAWSLLVVVGDGGGRRQKKGSTAVHACCGREGKWVFEVGFQAYNKRNQTPLEWDPRFPRTLDHTSRGRAGAPLVPKGETKEDRGRKRLACSMMHDGATNPEGEAKSSTPTTTNPATDAGATV